MNRPSVASVKGNDKVDPALTKRSCGFDSQLVLVPGVNQRRKRWPRSFKLKILKGLFSGNNHVKFQKSTSYTAIVITDESKFQGSIHFWVTFDLRPPIETNIYQNSRSQQA